MLRGSIAIEREFRIVNSSGRIRWISIKAEPIGGNAASPNRAAGICHDITRHREELQLLQRSEQRLQTIGGLTNSLFWIAKPDGSLPDDRRSPEVVRRSWDHLIHSDDKETFSAAWRHAVETRQNLSVEHRLQMPDGAFILYWSKAAPWISPSGQVKEWFGISKNLSLLNERPSPSCRVLTGVQVRSARALLNWSVDRLSQEAGIRPGTIRRLEEINGGLTTDEAEVSAIEKTLSDAGVEFTFLPRREAGGPASLDFQREFAALPIFRALTTRQHSLCQKLFVRTDWRAKTGGARSNKVNFWLTAR